MDLLCTEPSTNGSRAYADEVLLKSRVLRHLLEGEERYAATLDPHRHYHQEFTPEMRRILTEWMMEVCDEQKCQDVVFLLSVSLFDRFLAVFKSVKKSQLQIIATACMLIASKLCEPRSLPVPNLVFYTDYSITASQLRRWELLVVSTLKWDLSAVTPHDFLEHILRKLPVNAVDIDYRMVLSHAKTLIALCAREYHFLSYLPSTIASACIASALCGLQWCNKTGQTCNDLLEYLANEVAKVRIWKNSRLTCELKTCYDHVEDMVRSSTGGCSPAPSSEYSDLSDRELQFTPPPSPEAKLKEQKTARTPTDVRDVHF